MLRISLNHMSPRLAFVTSLCFGAMAVPLVAQDTLVAGEPDDRFAAIAQTVPGFAGLYWEGTTLVIESTNFTSKVAAFSARLGASGFEFGSADHLHLTERFTRIDSKTLQYEFTVNDPSTFAKPFTGRLPMNLTDQMIYEYACHEGNYGLQNILRGGRAADALAAQPGGALKR